jgi:hypothetical protein
MPTAAPSYHTAVVAFRLSLAGLAVASLFAIVVNLVGMPRAVVAPISVVVALLFLPTVVVTAANLTRTSILRFNPSWAPPYRPDGKAAVLRDVPCGRFSQPATYPTRN